jgi:hypothetical protein
LANSHQMAPAGKVNACTDCHINGNYALTTVPTDCGNAGCHLNLNYGGGWQGTNNPSHAAAAGAFPVAICSTCHNTISFLTATFDHSTTGFPLTNSHQMAPAGKANACTDCHINGNYTLTTAPTDCGNAGCHLNTNYGGGWQGTNNPVHSSAGAPFAAANCSTCHNTITFTTAVFDHSTTGFPLTGSHQLAPAGKVVACTDCHVGNNYTLPAMTCGDASCHLSAYNTAITPMNHVQLGFPVSQCSMCHDTVLWTDGKFDHSTTGWALQGAHTTAPCALCHVNNNYSLTTANTDCYGCHLAEWNSTVTLGGAVPNHVAALYPTTCLTCHTTWVTTGWLGATFNHTWFRIPHNGSVCSDCHLVSTDYSTFSCINCHTRAGAHGVGMSHPSVGGQYVYGATTCYNCHKN